MVLVTSNTKRRMARVAREHATDIELWHTATYLLQIGTTLEKGYFYPFLAASAFAFFAFEAYLNELGRRLFPDLWKRERKEFTRGPYLGTLGKFRYLAHRTGYAYSPTVRPFQTIKILASMRDHLAHGRAELYERTVRLARAESISNAPPKLMGWGRASFARRAIADVERVSDGLMAAAKQRGPTAARIGTHFGVRTKPLALRTLRVGYSARDGTLGAGSDSIVPPFGRAVTRSCWRPL